MQIQNCVVGSWIVEARILLSATDMKQEPEACSSSSFSIDLVLGRREVTFGSTILLLAHSNVGVMGGTGRLV